jgi:hypothetical protein
MAKVIVSALAGAIVGAVVLVVIAKMGGQASVSVSLPQPSGAMGTQEISLQGIITKLALIMGFSAGAIAGSLAGSAAKRN